MLFELGLHEGAEGKYWGGGRCCLKDAECSWAAPHAPSTSQDLLEGSAGRVPWKGLFAGLALGSSRLPHLEARRPWRGPGGSAWTGAESACSRSGHLVHWCSAVGRMAEPHRFRGWREGVGILSLRQCKKPGQGVSRTRGTVSVWVRPRPWLPETPWGSVSATFHLLVALTLVCSLIPPCQGTSSSGRAPFPRNLPTSKFTLPGYDSSGTCFLFLDWSLSAYISIIPLSSNFLLHYSLGKLEYNKLRTELTISVFYYYCLFVSLVSTTIQSGAWRLPRPSSSPFASLILSTLSFLRLYRRCPGCPACGFLCLCVAAQQYSKLIPLLLPDISP